MTETTPQKTMSYLEAQEYTATIKEKYAGQLWKELWDKPDTGEKKKLVVIGARDAEIKQGYRQQPFISINGAIIRNVPPEIVKMIPLLPEIDITGMTVQCDYVGMIFDYDRLETGTYPSLIAWTVEREGDKFLFKPKSDSE